MLADYVSMGITCIVTGTDDAHLFFIFMPALKIHFYFTIALLQIIQYCIHIHT